MEKNLLLAVALSMLVYLGWYAVLEKYYPHRAAQSASAVAPVGQRPAQALAPAGIPHEAVRLKSHGLEVGIEPLGASIASFRYPGPLGPVELVYSPAPGFFATWPNLRFVPVAGKEFAFEALHPGGVRILKEFLFSDYDGLHSMRLKLTNAGSKPADIRDLALELGPGLGTVTSELQENPRQWAAVVLRPPEPGKQRGVFEIFKPKSEPQAQEKPWSWLGLQNRYFLAAVVPPMERFSRFETGALPQGKTLVPWLRIEAAPIHLGPKSSLELEIPFYFGPKGYTHLSRFGLGLERSVNFGWFDRLGRFTLKVLHFLHDATGNWGWAIILLTILLQTLLCPLTYKSLKAAAAMKRIQPEVARIQQKFSKDPRRLNSELMELYKKSGANPLGGCLPMLAQMPIFIALFNTLRNAWELHGAPWMLWVKDLSAHDPYYVLPLIMGAIMFAQNKFNPPATADPAQAKMMTFMPVMFTFMFLKFPAGLVLYWLTNSLLNFAQQGFLRKRLT